MRMLPSLGLAALLVACVACGKQEGALPAQSGETTTTEKPQAAAGDEAPSVKLMERRRETGGEGAGWTGRWVLDAKALREQPAFDALGAPKKTGAEGNDRAWREAQAMLEDLRFDFGPDGALRMQLGGRILDGTWVARSGAGRPIVRTQFGSNTPHEDFHVELAGETMVLERVAEAGVKGQSTERLPLRRAQ